MSSKISMEGKEWEKEGRGGGSGVLVAGGDDGEVD